MSRDRRVAIFARQTGWHTARLIDAFARRGVKGVCVPLDACSFVTGDGVGGIVMPGFEDRLPRGAIVRLMSAGTFEQVTLRLGLLHALRSVGVPVCNDARAIECCVDKSMTTFLLAQGGLPTPETWVCESATEARAIATREIGAGRKLVLKPLFGAQGRGLTLLDDVSGVPEAEEIDGVYYLQRYVDCGSFHDWRVFVIGGRAVAAMVRHGDHWVTNVGQGARCEEAPLDEEMCALAVKAAKVVGARVAGIDIVRDPSGRLLVLEVNSMPAWQGLQLVSRVDLAQAIVDDFLDWLDRTSPTTAANAVADAG